MMYEQICLLIREQDVNYNDSKFSSILWTGNIPDIHITCGVLFRNWQKEAYWACPSQLLSHLAQHWDTLVRKYDKDFTRDQNELCKSCGQIILFWCWYVA